MNLLYRVHHPRTGRSRPAAPVNKRVARLLLTRPAALSSSQHALLGELTTACPEMTSLARLVGSFAALLRPEPGNEARLKDWAQDARS